MLIAELRKANCLEVDEEMQSESKIRWCSREKSAGVRIFRRTRDPLSRFLKWEVLGIKTERAIGGQ